METAKFGEWKTVAEREAWVNAAFGNSPVDGRVHAFAVKDIHRFRDEISVLKQKLAERDGLICQLLLKEQR